MRGVFFPSATIAVAAADRLPPAPAEVVTEAPAVSHAAPQPAVPDNDPSLHVVYHGVIRSSAGRRKWVARLLVPPLLSAAPAAAPVAVAPSLPTAPASTPSALSQCAAGVPASTPSSSSSGPSSPKPFWLGTFSHPKDAALAYDASVHLLHLTQPMYSLNFPGEAPPQHVLDAMQRRRELLCPCVTRFPLHGNLAAPSSVHVCVCAVRHPVQ